MKIQTKRGFTLIEILMVVLIIGVLTGIAVPQYQKVVEKSEAATALSLLKSVVQSVEYYILVNGKMPTKFEQLDMVFPSGWEGKEKIYDVDITDARSNDTWSIILGNQPEWNLVGIGRIKGRYAGSGFIWFVEKPKSHWDSIPVKQILCVEVLAASKYVYHNKNSVCATTFKGKFVGQGALKLYSFQF